MTATAAARAAPRTDAELDDALSAPDRGVIDALHEAPGDIIILGAGGKMGPTLARMARRAADALTDGRRIIAVSRFSNRAVERMLQEHGLETIRANLLDRSALARLPDAPNVIFMAGQKFGTRGSPSTTWAMNVLVPAYAAERYAGSRVVAFSTGNVYPLTPVGSAGSTESDELAPVGEYAQSCVGRERIFEFLSVETRTPVALIRLNYAIALRYGVLTDLALAVRDGAPIDLTMGYVNVIWQGDANAMALRALPHASHPPFVVNIVGPELLRVRDIATALGKRLGREPRFTGIEAPDALLSDASRSRALFGHPHIPAATLIEWTAGWIASGGTMLEKPTRFQARDGSF